MRVSVVATGMEADAQVNPTPVTLDVIARARSTLPKLEVTPVAEPVKPAAIVATEINKPEAVEEPEEPEGEAVAIETEEEVADEIVEELPATLAATGTDDAVGEKFATVETDQTPPPAATPSLKAAEAFIPAAPVDRKTEPAPRKADPFAGAAMANGAKPASARPTPVAGKSRGLSLFEKVTGTGRAAKQRPEMEEQEPGSAQQAQIGGLDPSDRISDSQSGDDLLDIPAFLRRQAN